MVSSEKSVVREAARREVARRRLTIAALAEQTGIPRPNLSNWLSGKRSLSLDNAERVMDALGLSVKPKKNAKK